MSHSASQYPQRRAFRGRGGPKDRRLPKHNAARRRPHPPPTDAADADAAAAARDGQDQHGVAVAVAVAVADMVETTPCDSPEQQESGEGVAIKLLSGHEQVQGGPPQPQAQREEPADAARPHEDEQAATVQLLSEALEKELNHLHTRIRNNRTAMSLSSTALANPAAYQTNVLAACQNTVAEWRSICKHYFSVSEQLQLEQQGTVRSTGQAIFELVQQSLQCGPLAGSQPGYFKRCGSEMAQMVSDYLGKIVKETAAAESNNIVDAIHNLGFTEKQATAVATWKRNAQKAADKGQPPSKSVLQNQGKAAAAQDRKKKTKKR